MTLGKSLSYSETQAPHLYNGTDDSTFLRGSLNCLLLQEIVIGLNTGVNELISVKCLEEFLALVST